MIRLLVMLIPVLARAEYLKIEMGFGGMECASCTEFIEGKFTRNRNVKSVHVDKQNSVLTLELKPDNKLRLEQVRDQVQQSGFTPKDTRVVVQGVAQNGALTISGLEQQIAVTDPKQLLSGYADKRVRVEGEVKTGAGRSQTLVVSKVEAAE